MNIASASSTHPTREHSRNTDIEVLRATAILFTLFAHWAHGWLGFLGPLGKQAMESTAFWTGVDLFFCISGFVIADSLLRQPLGPFTGKAFRIWVSAFWIRRAFRLLPSAWFWIAVSVVAVVFYIDDGSTNLTATTLKDALFAFLNIHNFHYIQCMPKNECGFLGVFWSLSLEEQFYLVLPALLFLVRNRTALVIGLAAICLLQVATPRWNGFLPEGSALWFIRTDAIILGVLIAFWKHHRSHAQAMPAWFSHRLVRGACVVLALVALSMVASPRWDAGWGTGFAALLSGLLVWIASYDRGYVLSGPKWVLDILLWFGARSYAMYLIHMTVLRFCYEAFTRHVPVPLSQAPGWAAAMLLTIAFTTFLFAELNYRYLETPLRLRGRRVASRIEAALQHQPPSGASKVSPAPARTGPARRG